MTEGTIEPLARKAQADLIVERAAEGLRKILKDLALQLDPFPPFPGAFFSYGIEVEPEAAARVDRGCVILAEDGEFYELQMGVDLEGFGPDGYADPVALRSEERKKLDLHPRDYIVFAHNAIGIVAELLLEREETGAAE